MKLSAVERCCKAAKVCCLFIDAGEKFIGDRNALYRVDELPEMDDSAIKMMWSITGKKADEFQVLISDSLPEPYSFGPLTDEDECLTRIAATVCGRTYFRSESGELIAVQDKYVRPFADDGDEITYIGRKTADGERYVCAMRGWFVQAVINPMAPLSEDLLREVGEIWNAESVAADAKGGGKGEKSDGAGADDYT